MRVLLEVISIPAYFALIAFALIVGMTMLVGAVGTLGITSIERVVKSYLW